MTFKKKTEVLKAAVEAVILSVFKDSVDAGGTVKEQEEKLKAGMKTLRDSAAALRALRLSIPS